MWAAGAGLVQILASYLLYRPAARLFTWLAGDVGDLYQILGHPTGWRAWIALPLVVVSEEVVFRGGLQGMLEKWLRPWGAMVAACAVYAAAHIASGSWTLVGLAAICGLYWGALRAVTKSLWPGLLCHLAWDLAILVAVPLTA